MNIALWIVQSLLAAMFFFAGFMKLTQPKAHLKEKMGDWVDVISGTNMKIIGLLELLGALGLILPMALNILPILTPLAAAGLALTMLVALFLHISRKEKKDYPKNIIIMLLCLFVLIGRWTILPVI